MTNLLAVEDDMSRGIVMIQNTITIFLYHQVFLLHNFCNTSVGRKHYLPKSKKFLMNNSIHIKNQMIIVFIFDKTCDFWLWALESLSNDQLTKPASCWKYGPLEQSP